MKIKIIENGVLQPFALFEFIFYLVFFGTIIVSAVVCVDLYLDMNPELVQKMNRPAPIWMVFVIWIVILLRTGEKG